MQPLDQNEKNALDWRFKFDLQDAAWLKELTNGIFRLMEPTRNKQRHMRWR